MFVTLSFGRLEPSLAPGFAALHEWLDSWSGIGVVERGMARQGYDLQLTRYANEGWRHVLRCRPRALNDAGDRFGLGADAVAGGARGGVGGAAEASSDWLTGLCRRRCRLKDHADPEGHEAIEA
jgi:hypothetical protein